MTAQPDLPLLPSPPLAPETLSPAQLRFLALHAHHLVTESKWHFIATWLCAKTDRRRAWLARDELDQLVELGLMEWGVGCADVCVTAAGRECVADSR